MKIGIDTRISTTRKTGVGYYISNLVGKLLEIDKENEYVLFGTDLQIRGDNSKQMVIEGFKEKLLSFLWKNFSFPKIEKIIGKAELLFCPNFTVVPANCRKIILTIHDLSYLKCPQFVDEKNVAFLKKFVSQSIKKTSHILAVSENSKKEIMESYNIPEERISVIYNAIDHNFFKPASKEAINEVKKKYNTGENYLLFTSTLEPRKNITGIIRAYLLLPEEYKDKFSLVLAGGKGWQDQELWQDIEKARALGNKIITTGYVSEEDLPALYSGAAIFTYPSLYEGFGIPIIEAMACGVPVITSNVSSMPEVVGDAAILVNPNKVEEITKSILDILNDYNLKNSLIDKGIKRAKDFSWEKSAKELIKLYKNI